MLVQILLGWVNFKTVGLLLETHIFGTIFTALHFFLYITAEYNRSHIWMFPSSFSFLLFFLFNFFKGTSSKRQRHSPSGIWDFICLPCGHKFHVVSLRMVLSTNRKVRPEVLSQRNTQIWNKEGQLFKMLKQGKCTGHLVTGGGVHFGALASFIHSLKAK